jgi:hypothetical protein
MAFLLTWATFIVGQFKPYFSTNDRSLYAFWTTVCVLNPLMGFWNAFVYVKPWTWEWKWQCFRWQKTKQSDNKASAPEAPISTNSRRASSGVGKGQVLSVVEPVYEEDDTAENGYGTQVKVNHVETHALDKSGNQSCETAPLPQNVATGGELTAAAGAVDDTTEGTTRNDSDVLADDQFRIEI